MLIILAQITEKLLCFDEQSALLSAEVLNIDLSDPCVFMLQPFATVFRIKLCMANAFPQE